MNPLAELLAEGAQALGGGAAARAEARLFLAHAAGLDRAALHRLGPEDLTPALRARYTEALARRRAGEPASHILGYRDFWTHRFRVGPQVLDPRPETETLVAAAVEGGFARVLDIGTGSGCILLSLLAERPEARGLGVDISDGALEIARANAGDLGLTGRATFVQGDWFAPVRGRFDLIVSNPPYIAEAEMAGLAPEVRLHEPRLALTDGGDGLGAYRAIAAGLAAHLAPGGRVLLEIGPAQAAAVSALLAGAGLGRIAVRPDLDGRDRVVSACAPE